MTPTTASRSPIFAVVSLLAALVVAVSAEAQSTSQLDTQTASNLLNREVEAVDTVDNKWFLPVADQEPALHALEGVLTVPRTLVDVSDSQYARYRWFPGFSVGFFTHDGYLVPVDSWTHHERQQLAADPLPGPGVVRAG